MNDLGKSDSPVVPSKPPNNPAAAGAEVVEERGLPEGNAASKTRPGRRAGQGAPNFDRYIGSSHTTCRGGRRMRARLGPGPASMEGPRELIADRLWQGEVKGVAGSRRVVHTADLVGIVPARRPAVIEVELARKSKARLRAILGLYCRWIASGKVGACVYVCGNGDVRKLVVTQAEQVGLRETDGSLRVEMLDAIKELVRDEARGVPRGTPLARLAR